MGQNRVDGTKGVKLYYNFFILFKLEKLRKKGRKEGRKKERKTQCTD